MGDGNERAALERLAESVGITDRVIWAGWSDEPRRYLSTFDVFVLPSRFEGFPLALLEALLARSAVVAADVGSISEAVVDGKTGLLVPADDPGALANAIRRLLAETGLRRRLGEQGTPARSRTLHRGAHDTRVRVALHRAPEVSQPSSLAVTTRRAITSFSEIQAVVTARPSSAEPISRSTPPFHKRSRSSTTSKFH